MPRWLARLLGLGRTVLRFARVRCPNANLLKSLSWAIARSRRAASLVPDNHFVRYVERMVAARLRFGRFVEIVAAPRSGKSAGAIRGVARWIVENDVRNFCVLVVAANRRLAETLYRYVVGALARLFLELRRNGVRVSRGDFFSRIRARLYLGSEQSCLAEKRDHFVEGCVKHCVLFRRFAKGWRKLPAVPFVDPWMLRFCGYCPFVAAQSKVFWYNSIVVLTGDALPMALACIVRCEIRNVIVVFDEYLVHLTRRGKLWRIDVDAVAKVVGGDASVLDGVRVWNWVVDRIEGVAVDRYSDVLRGADLAEAVVEKILRGIVDLYGDVRDYIGAAVGAAHTVVDVSKRLVDVGKKMFLRRLGSSMLMNALSMVSAVAVGGRLSRVVAVRWVRDGDGEALIGWAGGFVRFVVGFLLAHGRNVAVITTSVVSCDVGRYRVLPHESLEHVRIDVARIKRVVRVEPVLWRGDPFYPPRSVDDLVRRVKVREISFRVLDDLLSELMRVEGDAVVIVNKMIALWLADELKRRGFRVELVGDLGRGIVDYVVVARRGGVLLLVPSHGRCAYGVDPPVEKPRVVVILYGIRRPAREYIKVWRGTLRGLAAKVYRDGDVYFVYGGCDGKYEYIFVYDCFDAKFDKHMMLQIVGRWYAADVDRIVVNVIYSLDLGYYVPSDLARLLGLPPSPYVAGREPVRSFDEAVARVVGAVDLVGVDVEKIARRCYYGLKSVYNSFRYVRKQLRYRKLHDGDLWLLARKLAAMISGFDYAEDRSLEVPAGLKRFYRIYRDEGVGALLCAVKSWLGIGDEEWRVVLKRFLVCYGASSLRMAASKLRR